MHRMKSLFFALLAASALLLGGCATTLRSDVTSFQNWPTNSAGSTFSFKRLAKQADSLEHKSYEDLARAELAKIRLVEAPAGSKARFEVSLDYGLQTRVERTREAVWDDRVYWYPAHWHPTLGWRPGYWVRDPFGPSVIGYRTVSRQVNTRHLRVDISEGSAKVFEASASSSGSQSSLPVVMPYLIRSVFEGFPGTNGQVRMIDYDTERGTLKAVSNKSVQ
jgi:Domain of unknown function (DUF4136)